MPVTVTTTKEICGAPIGKLNEFGEGQFGFCDKAPHLQTRGGFNSHSSPELRAWRRDQTAKSRAKTKKLQETATPDASILDGLDAVPDEGVCSCGHTLSTCPNPKYCGLTPSQIEERQKREIEEAAEEESRIRRLAEQVVERQFITECLDKIAAAEVLDRQTEAKLTQVCASYLGFSGDQRFHLDAQVRIARNFNTDGINESRLSEVLYGPSFTGLNEPRSELDEGSFEVRLGRYLGVADMHGWRNVSYRYHPAHRTPTIPSGSPRLP